MLDTTGGVWSNFEAWHDSASLPATGSVSAMLQGEKCLAIQPGISS